MRKDALWDPCVLRESTVASCYHSYVVKHPHRPHSTHYVRQIKRGISYTFYSTLGSLRLFDEACALFFLLLSW